MTYTIECLEHADAAHRPWLAGCPSYAWSTDRSPDPPPPAALAGIIRDDDDLHVGKVGHRIQAAVCVAHAPAATSRAVSSRTINLLRMENSIIFAITQTAPALAARRSAPAQRSKRGHVSKRFKRGDSVGLCVENGSTLADREGQHGECYSYLRRPRTADCADGCG